MSLSDVSNEVLKKAESELLKSELTEKFNFRITYDEDIKHTPKPFWEELKSTGEVFKSSAKKFAYLILTYGFGASRLGIWKSLTKTILFLAYSSILIVFLWAFGFNGYIGYFLAPITIWMIGGFWAFFDLPVNIILKENHSSTILKIENFITEQKIVEKEELDLLENQLQKLEKFPDQKINVFRIILLGFYLLFSYFASESWRNEKPDINFICYGLSIAVLFYFFIESYASLKNSTFSVVYSAINNLKFKKVQEKFSNELSNCEEQKLSPNIKTEFITSKVNSKTLSEKNTKTVKY